MPRSLAWRLHEVEPWFRKSFCWGLGFAGVGLEAL